MNASCCVDTEASRPKDVTDHRIKSLCRLRIGELMNPFH